MRREIEVYFTVSLRLGFRAYKLRNVSHGISACPLALLQVARKTKGDQISLDLEGGGKKSKQCGFSTLLLSRSGCKESKWWPSSVIWTLGNRVKNEKLSCGLNRFYSSSFCICISSVFLFLPRLPYPSHINLQKLFPAFGILFEAKTQGSLSVPLGQSTSFFKTSLWES